MATVNNDQWIQGAIKNPGGLHQQLGVALNAKIPQSRIVKAASPSDQDDLLRRRALLAITLGKLRNRNK